MAKSQIIKDGIEVVANITRNNLERIGSLLDNFEANGERTSNFQSVDVDAVNASLKQDLFRQKTVEASQQLLGPRLSRYGKYAKKVVPDSVVKKSMDSIFIKIARLAANWSEVDLPNEHRLGGIKSLSIQERNALATDIANQNRALATMGGITGLAGIVGLFADALWLLLVSLRCVYQIAAVYDKPLTGKEGVKMAYKVLENSDLSKMQEKQTLLAGLGVARGLLDNAESRGFHSELKNAGLKDDTVQYYAQQVDELAEQLGVDFDKFDLSWVIKFIPLFSVGIGAYYNNQLIGQVIGVAKATFGPELKIAGDSNFSGVEAELSSVEKPIDDKDEIKSTTDENTNKDDSTDGIKDANDENS